MLDNMITPNNPLHTLNRPPLLNANINLKEVINERSWHYKSAIESKVLQILYNYEEIFNSLDISFNDLYRTILATYWYTLEYNLTTYTRVPNRFLVDVSHLSKDKVDNIMLILSSTDLLDIKQEKFYLLFKLNLELFKEDEYTNIRLKTVSKSLATKLLKVMENKNSIYFYDYNKIIKRRKLLENILCMMLAYSELNQEKLFTGTRFVKTDDRIVEIMYAECPTELIAYINKMSVKRLRQYLKRVCHSTNYIKQHDKMYSDILRDKDNRLKEIEYSPSHYLNKNYKNYELSNWRYMCDRNGNCYEYNHPRVTQDSYILFMENFRNCSMGKRVLAKYKQFKKIIISQQQFISIYKFLNLDNYDNSDSLRRINDDMKSNLSKKDMCKIARIKTMGSGVGIFDTTSENLCDEKVFKNRIRINDVKQEYSYSLVKKLQNVLYRLENGSKKDFKYNVEVYNTIVTELVARMVRSYEFTMLSIASSQFMLNCEIWKRDLYVLNDFKTINELTKTYTPKLNLDIRNKVAEHISERFDKFNLEYTKAFYLIGDGPVENKKDWFLNLIYRFENTDWYKSTICTQNLIIKYTDYATAYSDNPYKVFDCVRGQLQQKYMQDTSLASVVDREGYYDLKNWIQYFKYEQDMKNTKDNRIIAKIKKSLSKFKLKHYFDNISTLEDYVNVYVPDYKTEEEYETAKYLSSFVSEQNDITSKIEQIKLARHVKMLNKYNKLDTTTNISNLFENKSDNILNLTKQNIINIEPNYWDCIV